MAARLDIIIGADGKEVTQTLKQLKDDFKSLDKQLQLTQPGAGIADLNKKLADTRANMAAIKKFRLGEELGSIKPGANQASAALNDVSRVAQDLPYGFIGIGNNINPLIESFNRLKVSTGSTGGALKALASSLGGVGGIGLAVGVITAAITIYQNGIQGFNKKTKEASDKAKEFVETLRSSSSVSNDARNSVYGQIASLEALTSAILDANRSNKERKRLLEELDSQTNGRLGKITLEAANLATLTTRVKEYTDALIAQSVVKGFEGEISKVSVELFKQRQEYEKLGKAADVANKVLAKDKTSKAVNYNLNLPYLELVSNAKDASDALTTQGEVVAKLDGNMKDLKTGMSSAITELSKFQSISGKTSNSKIEKSALEIQIENLEKLKDRIGLSFSQEEILIDLKAKFFIDQNKWLSDLQKTAVLQYARLQKDDLISFDLPVKINLLQTRESVAQIITTLDAAKDNLSQGISRMYNAISAQGLKDGNKARRDFLKPLESLNEAVKNIVASGLQNLGSALGDVLGGANPAEAFINVITQALSQLGQALITYGIAMKAANNAMKFGGLNPTIAIVAGIAALAAGSLLKSKISKPQKFATGGIVTGPTMGLVGEAGPEAIIPLNRAGEFFGGGANNLDVTGRIVAEGDSLVVVFDRAIKRRGRLGG